MTTEKPRYNFDDIERLLREAHGDFVYALHALNMEHVQKPLQIETDDGPKLLLTHLFVGDNRRFFKYRDSAGFRAGGILFHLDLMRQTESQMQEWNKENRSVFPGPADHSAMERFVRMQVLLTEDIIFQVGSLVDYIANLTLIVLLGENEKKTSWNSFLNRFNASAQAKGEHILSSRLVAAAILDSSKSFLNKLYDLRSSVAHHGALSATASITNSFSSDRRSVAVFATERTLKSKLFDREYSWNKTEMQRVAQYVALRTLQHSTSILSELRKDVSELNQTKFIPEYFARMKVVSDARSREAIDKSAAE